jgi:hypothetical protein
VDNGNPIALVGQGAGMQFSLPDAPILRSTAHVPRDVARDRQRRSIVGSPNRDLQRLIRGAFTTTEAWATLDAREQHCMLVLAALPLLPDRSTLSHLSAAAVMGWPHIGRWPDKVIAHDPTRRRTEQLRFMTLHPEPPGLERLRGAHQGMLFDVCTPALVAAELARTQPFEEAVVVLDHALRSGVPRQTIAGHVESLGHRGSRAGHRALVFADPRAASPGESWARALFAVLGAQRPMLQHPFHGPNGEYAEVDFWFPLSHVIVEFDGESKYRNPEFLRGRTAEQAVIDEKYREDWLRALDEVRGFVRLRWRDLNHPHVVAQKLRGAGIPLPS